MKKDWSIGLMTGTVNDGNIDIAALRTDGEEIFESNYKKKRSFDIIHWRLLDAKYQAMPRGV